MQGPSPDEVALVDAARTLGFEFVARSRTHVTLRLHGEEVRPLHGVYVYSQSLLHAPFASNKFSRASLKRPKDIEREAQSPSRMNFYCKIVVVGG